MTEAADIQLAEMIHVLRAELEESMRRSQGQLLSFTAEKVELELKVAITNNSAVEGGVKFWVISAGGELNQLSATTHTFTLTLIPKRTGTNGQVDVSDTEHGKQSNE